MKELPENRNRDNSFERPTSTSEVTDKRLLIALMIFVGSVVGTTSCKEIAEVKDKISDTIEARKIKDNFENLLGIRPNIKSKRGELMGLIKGSPMNIAKRAPLINTKLQELIQILEGGIGEIKEIKKTSIKLAPGVIYKQLKEIDAGLRMLNPNINTDLRELDLEAKNIQDTKYLNWIRRKFGVNPVAIVRMNRSIKKLRKTLSTFKSELLSISSKEVANCSNNAAVDTEVMKMMGSCAIPPPDPCTLPNLSSSYRGKDVEELKRYLVEQGYLSEKNLNSDVFDWRTKKALTKLQIKKRVAGIKHKDSKGAGRFGKTTRRKLCDNRD